MKIDFPIKRSALYTKPYGLKVEPELKRKIDFLSTLEKLGVENPPDVPEVVRICLRSVIDELYNQFKDKAS